MSLEASKIEAKQESLDATITDLVRIVGKLDKKIDDYQQENRKAISELKADNAELKADNAESKADNAELKAGNAELKAGNAEIKAMLQTLLSR